MFWFDRFFPAFNDCLCSARKKPGNENAGHGFSANHRAPSNINVLKIGNEVVTHIETQIFRRGRGRGNNNRWRGDFIGNIATLGTFDSRYMKNTFISNKNRESKWDSIWNLDVRYCCSNTAWLWSRKWTREEVVRNRVMKSDLGLHLLPFSDETRTKSMKFAIFTIC